MNKYQQLWVEALRSGKYKQGKGVLHHIPTDTYCCLGVACEVLTPILGLDVQKYDDATTSYDGQVLKLPSLVAQALDITRHGTLYNNLSLMRLNDDLDYTFDQIADIIEKGNLCGYV